MTEPRVRPVRPVAWFTGIETGSVLSPSAALSQLPGPEWELQMLQSLRPSGSDGALYGEGLCWERLLQAGLWAALYLPDLSSGSCPLDPGATLRAG